MRQEEAEKKLSEHLPIHHLIFGIVARDGEFFFDCAACVNDDDLKKEARKFFKYRTFTVKENNP